MADVNPPEGLTHVRTWSRALVTVAVVAAVAAWLPGVVGRTAGIVAVAAVVAGPVLRTVLLAATWRDPADRRFVLAAGTLAAIVLVGALLG